VVHLNTPGGDAMEGVAIANVLRAHRARVVVRIDGMAASTGSVIAMAGDEIIMGIGSELMVHDAWGIAVGDEADMLAYARRLSTTSNSIASTYAARAGGTVDDWRLAMRAEQWYTAEEAVEAGLADRVAAADETGTAEGEQVTPGRSLGGWWDMWDSLRSPERFDLSAFNYAGRAHAPAPTMPARTKTPAASAGGSSEQGRGRDVAFSDEQLSTMRGALGLPEDANETTIVAAVNDRCSAKAEPALPDGVVTVEKAQLDELKAAAELGRLAHNRQQAEDRAKLVQAAIDDGRIAPARREYWVNALEKDAEGGKDALASLEPGLIPVDQEIGHAGDGEGDPLYAAVFGKEA
jgi:membrane-bound ClpP family serine protease